MWNFHHGVLVFDLGDVCWNFHKAKRVTIQFCKIFKDESLFSLESYKSKNSMGFSKKFILNPSPPPKGLSEIVT